MSVTSIEIDVGSRSSLSPSRRSRASVSERLVAASFSLTETDANEAKVASPQDSDGLSFSETVANFVVYLVGGGILLLPTVMRDVGLGSALILMAVAFATTYWSGVLVITCCTAVESASANNAIRLDSYEALAGEVLGLPGTVALALTKNGYLLGLLVVFSLMVTDGMETWSKAFAQMFGLSSLEKNTLRWCGTLPLFATLAMVRDLKQVKRFATVGIFAAFSQCVLIALGAVLEMGGPQFVQPQYDLARGGIFDLGAAMATCLFSCGSVVCTIPSIRSQMARREQLPEALRMSLMIVISIYLVVMTLCYFAFGENLAGNVLDSITDDCWPGQCVVGTITGTVLVMNLMISIPPVTFFVISVIEATGNFSICTTLSWANIAFRACLMTFLVYLGMKVPFVDKVTSIISASFGGCNCLVFPLLFYCVLRCRFLIAQAPAVQRRKDCIKHVVIVLVAIVAMPFGVSGAVQSLLKEVAKARAASLAPSPSPAPKPE